MVPCTVTYLVHLTLSCGFLNTWKKEVLWVEMGTTTISCGTGTAGRPRLGVPQALAPWTVASHAWRAERAHSVWASTLVHVLRVTSMLSGVAENTRECVRQDTTIPRPTQLDLPVCNAVQVH
jgi:hypothetical protein